MRLRAAAGSVIVAVVVVAGYFGAGGDHRKDISNPIAVVTGSADALPPCDPPKRTTECVFTVQTDSTVLVVLPPGAGTGARVLVPPVVG